MLRSTVSWEEAARKFVFALYASPAAPPRPVLQETLAAVSSESSQWKMTLQLIAGYCEGEAGGGDSPEQQTLTKDDERLFRIQVRDAKGLALLQGGHYAAAEAVCTLSNKEKRSDHSLVQRLVWELCNVQQGRGGDVVRRLIAYFRSECDHGVVALYLQLHFRLLTALTFSLASRGHYAIGLELLDTARAVPALAEDTRLESLRWYFLPFASSPRLTASAVLDEINRSFPDARQRRNCIDNVVCSLVLHRNWLEALSFCGTLQESQQDSVKISTGTLTRVLQMASLSGSWSAALRSIDALGNSADDTPGILRSVGEALCLRCAAVTAKRAKEKNVRQAGSRIGIRPNIVPFREEDPLPDSILLNAFHFAAIPITDEPWRKGGKSSSARPALVKSHPFLGVVKYLLRRGSWRAAFTVLQKQVNSFASAIPNRRFDVDSLSGEMRAHLQGIEDAEQVVSNMPWLPVRRKAQVDEFLLNLVGPAAVPSAPRRFYVPDSVLQLTRGNFGEDTAEALALTSSPLWAEALLSVKEALALPGGTFVESRGKMTDLAPWVPRALSTLHFCHTVGRWEEVLKLYSQLYRKPANEIKVASEVAKANSDSTKLLEMATVAAQSGKLWWAASALLDVGTRQEAISPGVIREMYRLLPNQRWEDVLRLYELTASYRGGSSGSEWSTVDARRQLLRVVPLIPKKTGTWVSALKEGAQCLGHSNLRYSEQWTQAYAAAVVSFRPQDAQRIADWARAQHPPTKTYIRDLNLRMFRSLARAGAVDTAVDFLLGSRSMGKDHQELSRSAIVGGFIGVLISCLNEELMRSWQRREEIGSAVEMFTSLIPTSTPPESVLGAADVFQHFLDLALRRGATTLLARVYGWGLSWQPQHGINRDNKSFTRLKRVHLVSQMIEGDYSQLIQVLGERDTLSSGLVLEWIVNLAQQGLLWPHHFAGMPIGRCALIHPEGGSSLEVAFHLSYRDFSVQPQPREQIAKVLRIPASLFFMGGSRKRVFAAGTTVYIGIPFATPSEVDHTDSHQLPSLVKQLHHVDSAAPFLIAEKVPHLSMHSLAGQLRECLRVLARREKKQHSAPSVVQSSVPSSSSSPVPAPVVFSFRDYVSSYWEPIAPVSNMEAGLVGFVPIQHSGPDFFEVHRHCMAILEPSVDVLQDFDEELLMSESESSTEGGRAGEQQRKGAALSDWLDSTTIQKYSMKLRDCCPASRRLLVALSFDGKDEATSLMRDLLLKSNPRGPYRVAGGTIGENTAFYTQFGLFCYSMEVKSLAPRKQDASRVKTIDIPEQFRANWKEMAEATSALDDTVSDL